MTRSIPCPYCPRLFANTTDLHQHIKSKRRISTAHGLSNPWRCDVPECCQTGQCANPGACHMPAPAQFAQQEARP
jgi:hypothetical protein